MPLNAAMIAQKWASRAGGAGDAYKAGVDQVSVSPTEKAAQAKDKYLQNVQKAASEGRYESGLRRVSLADWQRASKEKGVANYQNGIRAGTAKMQTFLSKFLPEVDRIKQEIAGMPSATDADMEQRMLANMRKMRELKGRI